MGSAEIYYLANDFQLFSTETLTPARAIWKVRSHLSRRSQIINLVLLLRKPVL